MKMKDAILSMFEEIRDGSYSRALDFFKLMDDNKKYGDPEWNFYYNLSLYLVEEIENLDERYREVSLINMARYMIHFIQNKDAVFKSLKDMQQFMYRMKVLYIDLQKHERFKYCLPEMVEAMVGIVPDTFWRSVVRNYIVG